MGASFEYTHHSSFSTFHFFFWSGVAGESKGLSLVALFMVITILKEFDGFVNTIYRAICYKMVEC